MQLGRNFIIAVVLLTVFQGNAVALWIDGVEVIPEQPLEIDIITFNIFGTANGRPSQVAYDEFSQDRTSLQLDLYIDVGVLPASIDLCVSNGTNYNLSLVFLKKDRNNDCW